MRRELAEYLRELSEYGNVGADYPYFDAYWQKGERRWPYLIEVDGEAAGFALVNTFGVSGRPVDFAMAEFYVAPAMRGRGVGGFAVGEVFARHQGIWEIGVFAGNIPALAFWSRVLSSRVTAPLERTTIGDRICFRIVPGAS